MSDSDRTVIVESGGSGVGTAMLAIVFLVILVVAGFILYRTGVLGGRSHHTVDININKPGIVMIHR